MNDNQDNSTVETEAPDMVNHPPHYTDGPDLGKLECIDITSLMPFTLGNAFKYVWRAGKKGDKARAREDLYKAEFYLEFWEKQRFNHPLLYPDGAMRMVLLLFRRISSCVPGNNLETARRFALDNIACNSPSYAKELIFKMRRFFE